MPSLPGSWGACLLGVPWSGWSGMLLSRTYPALLTARSPLLLALPLQNLPEDTVRGAAEMNVESHSSALHLQG